MSNARGTAPSPGVLRRARRPPPREAFDDESNLARNFLQPLLADRDSLEEKLKELFGDIARREHEGGLAGRGLFDVLTKLLRNKKLLLGGGGRKKRALADLSDAEVVLLLEYVNEMSTTGNETAIVESIAGEAQSYNDLD